MAAHHHRTLRNRRGGARRRRAGMTLPELIVSVAILGIMVMTFGMAITTARRLVWGSQRTMTVNAEATAIARVLRDDVSRLTKDGFLAIVAQDVGDNNDIPADHLVFTAVGTYRSLVDPTILAPAARIDYGLTAASLLWRRAVLLSPNPGLVRPGDNNNDDHEKFALEYYKLYTKPNLTSFVTIPSTFTYPPPDDFIPMPPYGTGVWTFNAMTAEPLNLTSSPNTKLELTNQWPQLANGVTSFRIQYLDASSGLWTRTTSGTKLWWYEDTDWPKALKIALTLKLDMKRSTTTKEDVDERDYRYEVIIHVPD